MFTIIAANPEPRYVDPSLRQPVSVHPIRTLRKAATAIAARRSHRPPARPASPERLRAEFDARFTL